MPWVHNGLVKASFFKVKYLLVKPNTTDHAELNFDIALCHFCFTINV